METKNCSQCGKKYSNADRCPYCGGREVPLKSPPHSPAAPRVPLQRPSPPVSQDVLRYSLDSGPAPLVQIPFGTNDFAENPEPRVPCALVLDVSASMAGRPIAELNRGLAEYKDELIGDSLASKRVEVAVVTFGGKVETVCDFTTADHFFPPTLEPVGLTPMGEAVNQAIDMLELRKQQYRSNGISYYRPWLVLITDGAPNDAGWEDAAERSRQAEAARAFALFPIGVEGADMDVLAKFSSRQPLKLKGLEFRKMFQWLSNSQRAVSRSTPGDEVPLPNPVAPDGWAAIA